MGDWKKTVQRRRKEKNSCRMNCNVRLKNCTFLNGSFATTLYCSFDVLVLVYSVLPSFRPVPVSGQKKINSVIFDGILTLRPPK